MAALREFLNINIFRKSDPVLPAAGDPPADDENVLVIEKRKLADQLGITEYIRNLDAIVKALGGENADASQLVRERRNAILTRFDRIFEHFREMKKDLVKNKITIAEAHKAALKLAEAEMEANMKQVDSMYPERAEQIQIARTLAKQKAEIY
jgi:adenine-specific DNA methylase